MVLLPPQNNNSPFSLFPEGMHRNFPLCSANHFPYPESVCAYAAGVDVPYFGEKKGKLSIHWGELGVREKCDHRNVCPLGTVAGDAVKKQEEQQQQQRKTTHPHIVSHVAVARAAEVNGPRCKLVFPGRMPFRSNYSHTPVGCKWLGVQRWQSGSIVFNLENNSPDQLNNAS